jgi:lipopolysaccharide exporter
MSAVRKALVFSFLESYFGLALNIVSFTLLARLLTPQQIGVYSVALAIISVMQVIRDFGLVNFLIQKKELTKDYISTAWGLSLLLGGTLFLLVQLGAPMLGRFYSDDTITTIAHIVAFNFLLLPLNSVCLALLKRDMKFQMVMRINMAAAAVGTLGTLLLAWLGWGALSLAIGSIANSVTVAISILLIGAATHLGIPSLSRVREILTFGGQLTAANIITSISMDVNDLAVGKILGFNAVAMISRGQGLMNLFHRDFMSAVRNVAFPAFAQANRNGQPMEEKYITAVTAVTALAWPFYGFMSLFPLDVIRIMFGTQWDAAAALVPYFCIAGAFSASINLIQTVMMSLGHANLVSRADFVFQPIRAMALVAVIFYFRELQPFAIMFLAVSALSVPYFYYIKQKSLPSDFLLLGKKLGGNLLLTAVTLLPGVLVQYFFRQGSAPLDIPIFLFCVALTAAAWLGCMILMRHPLYLEIKQMRERRRKAADLAARASVL